MPVETTVSIDDHEAKAMFTELRARFKNLQPAMKVVGEILLTSVR